MNEYIIAAEYFGGELYIKASDYRRVVRAQVAAERNKLADWMLERSYATGHGDTVEDLLKELEWQVRKSEREACIRDCDSVDVVGADDCIAAIRARGQDPMPLFDDWEGGFPYKKEQK